MTNIHNDYIAESAIEGVAILLQEGMGAFVEWLLAVRDYADENIGAGTFDIIKFCIQMEMMNPPPVNVIPANSDEFLRLLQESTGARVFQVEPYAIPPGADVFAAKVTVDG